MQTINSNKYFIYVSIISEYSKISHSNATYYSVFTFVSLPAYDLCSKIFFFLLKGSFFFFFLATVGCFGGQTLGICKALSDTFDCNRHYLNKADEADNVL